MEQLREIEVGLEPEPAVRVEAEGALNLMDIHGDNDNEAIILFPLLSSTSFSDYI